WALAFSPDGKFLLTGSPAGSARLWDAATTKPVGPPLVHGKLPITALAFNEDGQSFWTGGWDKTLRLWEMPVPIEGPVDRLFSWAEVLTGMELDRDGTIRVLEAKSWQERRQRLDPPAGPAQR